MAAESYGGFLTSVLINKLPPEIKLIINRSISSERWELSQVLEILNRKVNAQEHTATSTTAALNARHLSQAVIDDESDSD